MEDTSSFITFVYLIALCFLLTGISLWRHFKQPKMLLFLESPRPINWPVMGMLPGVILNHQRFTIWCSEILLPIPQSTFRIKGPWFSTMELLLTSNPINVQHVLSKRHLDFHKGSRFNEIFDYLGDGIFNVDHELWKYQRRVAHSAFTNPRFHRFMASSVKDKLERGLIPILERAWKQNVVIDLQDIFTRLTSDTTSVMLTGYDPNSLRFDCPSHFFFDAAHEGEEVILTRHLLPESVWKMQRLLGVGIEGRLKRIINKVDNFFYEFIAEKRKEVKKNKNQSDSNGVDLFTLYIEDDCGGPEHGFKSTDRFLRDTFVTFMLAGQDTVSSSLSWFFWLLSQNPRVEANIKEEMILENVSINEDDKCNNITTLLFQGTEEKTKLVYLHAAIYEALRLYPPVPNNHRAAIKEETLPTGHKVGPQTMIILCAYTMGRMEELWGKDCLEFKPERWITEEGTIRNESAHKFLAFNAGPRICLGKDISILEMKAVICNILARNYRVKLVEGQTVEPGFSCILHLKHGLKVNILKE